jgi:uncharacterized membrane protein
MNAQAAPSQQLTKSRIEALSDGIFAVAMARLVLTAPPGWSHGEILASLEFPHDGVPLCTRR